MLIHFIWMGILIAIKKAMDVATELEELPNDCKMTNIRINKYIKNI